MKHITPPSIPSRVKLWGCGLQGVNFNIRNPKACYTGVIIGQTGPNDQFYLVVTMAKRHLHILGEMRVGIARTNCDCILLLDIPNFKLKFLTQNRSPQNPMPKNAYELFCCLIQRNSGFSSVFWYFRYPTLPSHRSKKWYVICTLSRVCGGRLNVSFISF